MIASNYGGHGGMTSSHPTFFPWIKCIIRFKPACALTIFTIILGCVATSDQIKDMNQRQTQLESEVNQLSQDIEKLKSRVKGVEQDNTKLKERLYKLEKNEGFAGFPSAKSPDALYQIADSYL